MPLRHFLLGDIGGVLDSGQLGVVEPKGAAIGTAVEFDGLSSVILALLGFVRYYIDHDDTQHDGVNHRVAWARYGSGVV